MDHQILVPRPFRPVDHEGFLMAHMDLEGRSGRCRPGGLLGDQAELEIRTGARRRDRPQRLAELPAGFARQRLRTDGEYIDVAAPRMERPHGQGAVEIHTDQPGTEMVAEGRDDAIEVRLRLWIEGPHPGSID
jgi:hypothetical protein